MAEQKNTRLEKLQTKQAQLSAQVAAEKAKARAKEKKTRDALLYLWGEVVETALKDGSLQPADWQALCKNHLPEGRKRELAINEIEKNLPNMAIVEPTK
jgi:hypothetical protein